MKLPLIVGSPLLELDELTSLVYIGVEKQQSKASRGEQHYVGSACRCIMMMDYIEV